MWSSDIDVDDLFSWTRKSNNGPIFSLPVPNTKIQKCEQQNQKIGANWNNFLISGEGSKIEKMNQYLVFGLGSKIKKYLF